MRRVVPLNGVDEECRQGEKYTGNDVGELYKSATLAPQYQFIAEEIDTSPGGAPSMNEEAMSMVEPISLNNGLGNDV
jgi:hypothetical protein